MGKRNKRNKNEGEQVRVRMPKKDQMFAVVEQRLGYNKMYVRCQDGRVRIGRVPGRYSRRLWIREGDLVLIELWQIEREKKCDIIYRYTGAQKAVLDRKGALPEDMK